MKTFDELGYEVVHEALSKQTAEHLAIELELVKDLVYFTKNADQNNKYAFGDRQVDKSFAWYGAIATEALLIQLQPIIEQVTGKTLYPAYSYSRIYYNEATMAAHTDRPSCQYSATITIEVDETGPWEIWMENLAGATSALVLPVGTMVVYSGDKLKHWRNQYNGKKQIQVFLHYVDANGIYADFKFDKRPILGLSNV